jgi:uncharacterized protein with HEPN domain
LTAKAQEISRLLFGASHEFGTVHSDFQSRWRETCVITDPMAESSGLGGASIVTWDGWLEEVLESLPDAPNAEDATGGPARPFDPSRDSAAAMIDWAEQMYLDHFDHGRFDDPDGERERAWQAFNWIHQALDLEAVESRLREFPNIVVPQRVSEKYNLDDPRGLYRYLIQVRLAYIIGADLAAIALCRAATDLLIRRHYAPNARENVGLHSLITEVQARPKFNFLKKNCLLGKVKEANSILHACVLGDNVHELPTRYRVLIRDWVELLQKMIDDAPEGTSDSLSSPVLRLSHIIEAIERIRGEMDGVSLEAFAADWRKRWLVERGVEVISEASLHLSDELKARHTKIPWSKMAGIGNVLRDHYDRARPGVLWEVAKKHLPRLETACRRELAAAGS